MSDPTWRVRIVDDFMRQGVDLVVWRPRPDGMVEVVGGDGTITTTDPAIQTGWPSPYITIPDGALDALRAAIDDRLGRRYDESLVLELRGQVEAERDRVDRVLGAFLHDVRAPA